MDDYAAADVTSHHRQPHQQLFSPPSETFQLPTNLPMQASSPTLQDLHSQQSFLYPLLSDNHQQQQQQLQQHQQLSEIMPLPFARSKFRDVNAIGHQNGLIGLTGADQNDIAQFPHRSPPSAPFWRSNSNGASEQGFAKFQRIDSAMPSFQHQATELDYHSGSGGGEEVYETQHFPNPNSASVSVPAPVPKCSKCNGDCNAEDEKLERQLKLLAQSFESQILAHQERMYERFTAKIEELERKRNEREESRRVAEAKKARAQAEARAQEQAAVASREAVLVSYLEKITGGKVQLPAVGGVNGGRWPTEEVDALVKLRSEMESRFKKPGSKKNPLWELWDEISAGMGKLGFHRDARRCKEKWENIRKYYEKKKKEEGDEEGGGSKKRRRNKGSGYLDKLSELYCSGLKANGNNGDSKGSSNLESYSNDNVDQISERNEAQIHVEGNADDHPSRSKSEEIQQVN